jgi:hypothetical protein
MAASIFCAWRVSHAAAAPIPMAYEADPDCPTAQEFVRRVRQTAEAVEFVPVESPRAEVRVQLHAAANAASGRLEVQRQSGTYVRELVGSSCHEAASALAFVLAQTLLPDGASDAPEAVGEPGIVERTRTVVPPTVFERPAPPPAGASAELEWWAGVQAGLRSAPLPSWAMTQGAFVELRLGKTARFVPSIELGVVRSGPASVEAADWNASVSWLAGRVAICPARIGLTPRVAVAPCVGTHVGGFWATGEPQGPRGRGASQTAPWVDGLLALRIDVGPSDWISLRLDVELIAVVSRYELAFDNPNTLILRTPAFTGAASLGVVLKLW